MLYFFCRLSNETALTSKHSYIDELIPTTPGDNSHYVEGQSRYIWMPDGDGAPLLVDLLEVDDQRFEERSVADTEFWLFTRYWILLINNYRVMSSRHTKWISKDIEALHFLQIRNPVLAQVLSVTVFQQKCYESECDRNYITSEYRKQYDERNKESTPAKSLSE